jgi:hypothetical protein
MSQTLNERARRGGAATARPSVVRGAQIVRVSHLEFGDLTPAEAREMDRQIMRAYDVIGQVTRQGVIGGSLS